MLYVLNVITLLTVLACGMALGLFIASRHPRSRCWHHDIGTGGGSWVDGRLIDFGRRKMFRCSKCDKTEIV